MLTLQNRRLAFLILASPFFLNDFGFIWLDGSYGIYALDYAVRGFVIMVCFAWPLSRAIISEEPQSKSNPTFMVLAIILLPLTGLLLHGLIERPFIELTGWRSLFNFGQIENTYLYWLDLIPGLFLVALSEELVFRKLGFSWLQSAGKSALQIVLISASLFALIHWGSGPGRVLLAFVIGAIYMFSYLKIGRIWPLVLAHWFNDFLAFGLP